MSDNIPPGTPATAEEDGPIDLSRFQETGEGFTVVKEGEGDLPVYDWSQNDPQTITEEQDHAE